MSKTEYYRQLKYASNIFFFWIPVVKFTTDLRRISVYIQLM